MPPSAAPRSHEAVYQTTWAWVSSAGVAALPVRDFCCKGRICWPCAGCVLWGEAHRTLPRRRDAPPLTLRSPPSSPPRGGEWGDRSFPGYLHSHTGLDSIAASRRAGRDSVDIFWVWTTVRRGERKAVVNIGCENSVSTVRSTAFVVRKNKKRLNKIDSQSNVEPRSDASDVCECGVKHGI